MSKIGLLFPGQGSQYVGMGQDLYDNIESAKYIMDMSNDILGFDIKKIILDGKEEELKTTEIAQPAIYIVSAMYFEKFKQLDMDYEIVAGHSLGEYSALYTAGVFKFEEGLNLVKRRGLEMRKQNSLGTMYAIMGLDISEIKKYIECTNGRVVIANINSAKQIVISGYNDEIDRIANKISTIDGIKVVKLNVSGAFHSPLMKESYNVMCEEIDKIVFNKPNAFVIPNITGKITDNPNDIKNYLKQQIIGSVQWLSTILCMKDYGIEKLFEIGPGHVLKKINKSIVMKPKCEEL